MIEIKALEKLRKLTICDKGEEYTVYLDAGNIADEIESEIAKRFMELPVDADGVPIHVGDRLHEHEDGHEFTVDGLKIWGNDLEWWAYQESGIQAPASRCTHVKKRTLEDTLREMLDRNGDGIGLREFNRDFDAFVEHYAAEIRELMGGAE